MRGSYRTFALIPFAMSGLLASCTDSQPPYECAARNAEVYQVRFYPLGPSSCPPDSGITTNLLGTTAGLESYSVISPDGGGGAEVNFYDERGKLDRSASKLGLRLGILVNAPMDPSCLSQQADNCTEIDPDLGCQYCLIGTLGPSGKMPTLKDGGSAFDMSSPPTPGTQLLPLEVSYGGGKTKRISLTNMCSAPSPSSRASVPAADPNVFFMLPRASDKGICSALDAGNASSETIYPEVLCANSSVMAKVKIKTTLMDFKLVSTAKIPGTLATATVKFEETTGSSAACTSIYRAVFLQPKVNCVTNLDCSPVPVPNAVKCSNPSPAIDDYCYTGTPPTFGQEPIGVTNVSGSGISPFIFRKYADGGYDLRDTCDPLLKVCIWDIDAGT